MTPIQKLLFEFLYGDPSAMIDLPSEPCASNLQASFLTVALNIIGQTNRAMAVIEGGELVHCALYAPQSALVLDASGIRPATVFENLWSDRRKGKVTIQEMTITELEVLCPPESAFFARALASFEKVVAKYFKLDSLPPILGFQVQNKFGNNWLDRPSYEILPQDRAHQALVDARSSQPDSGWSMVAILDGDIEEPTFV